MVTSPCIDPAVLAGPPGFHTGNPTPIKSPHGHRLQAGYERWKASTLTHLVDGALGGLPPPVSRVSGLLETQTIYHLIPFGPAPKTQIAHFPFRVITEVLPWPSQSCNRHERGKTMLPSTACGIKGLVE